MMRKSSNDRRPLDLICRIIAILAVAYLCFRVVRHEFFAGWWSVRYDYDVAIPSPDGRYTVVVIRGDRAAFDDFFYRVFVFPKTVTPEGMSKGTLIRPSGVWNDSRYLVYVGYAVPCLRWTSPHEVEIDLDDLYDEVDEFHPVPKVDAVVRDNSSALLVSLVLNKQDKQNVIP